MQLHPCPNCTNSIKPSYVRITLKYKGKDIRFSFHRYKCRCGIKFTTTTQDEMNLWRLRMKYYKGNIEVRGKNSARLVNLKPSKIWELYYKNII